MPRLMARFGVTVENGEAPVVAARDDAGDLENSEAPAVAARGDAGNSEVVAEERSSKGKRGDTGN
jgi:hypothetical protein